MTTAKQLILAVDDNPKTCSFGKTALQQRIEVAMAQSGQQALNFMLKMNRT